MVGRGGRRDQDSGGSRSPLKSGRRERARPLPPGRRAHLAGLALIVAATVLSACFGIPSPTHGAPVLTPSPADWRDIVIYQILTDRFADGVPGNNAAEGNYLPADGARIHGGDFAGIEAKLDYLTHLGVNAVWISPVVLNANAEYHGYAARDLYAIAPHFGTLAELQSLAAACHARGIHLILDVVTNHMGDLIDSGGSGYPSFKYPGTYPLRWRNPGKRHAGFFDDLSRFHAHGHIGSFSDPEQIVGELFGLDDLATENPAVRAELAAAAQWLITNTDCDGFRIDTVKHVEMGFWDTWSPLVHTGAAGQGKAAFFMFGEVFDGDDAKVGSYTGTMSGGNYKLDSVLHFPMYFTATDVFAFDAPPAWISARYAALGHYDPTSRERLVTFLDNHDVARFQSFGIANQDESRLRAALGWLLTARGIPSVYYGTEQEFDGGGDPWNREDMWDGAWDFGPSQGDNFDLAHPLFGFTARLIAARRHHDALRRGTTTELVVEAGGPGLYVYRRQSATDTVLVAVNTANEPRTVASLATPWVPGAVLEDALEPSVRDTIGTLGTVALAVPARGLRVLASAAARAVAPRPLRIETIFPGHDQALNDLHSPLTIVFDRDVNLAALSTALQWVPATAGSFEVDGRVARFRPAAPWTVGTGYTWTLDAIPVGADGAALPARYEARFRTPGAATGLSLPAGLAADEIARQGLTAPEGILAAPWIEAHTLLLSDTGRDRLFTLSPGGDLGHWLGDGRWIKPEGLARTAAGGLAVADENGVFLADIERLTTRLIPGSGATGTGAIAAGGPAFGSLLYLCDPSADRVVKLQPNGSLVTFATNVRGGEGLAFGPGGPWGSDLYVADADLTSLGTQVDGPGRIVRLGPGGAETPVAQSPLLRGASALAFGRGGAFGDDLYVADILDERILRVTAGGTVEVFASGFNNLSGSHALAFGADGALYVADPGSGQPFSNSNGTRPPRVLRIAAASAPTGVPPGPPPSALSLTSGPNPARGRLTFAIGLMAARATRLEIHDVAGRRVLARDLGVLPAAVTRWEWDGRDSEGRRVAAGLYLARLTAGNTAITRRLVILP